MSNVVASSDRLDIPMAAAKTHNIILLTALIGGPVVLFFMARVVDGLRMVVVSATLSST